MLGNSLKPLISIRRTQVGPGGAVSKHVYGVRRRPAPVLKAARLDARPYGFGGGGGNARAAATAAAVVQPAAPAAAADGGVPAEPSEPFAEQVRPAASPRWTGALLLLSRSARTRPGAVGKVARLQARAGHVASEATCRPSPVWCRAIHCDSHHEVNAALPPGAVISQASVVRRGSRTLAARRPALREQLSRPRQQPPAQWRRRPRLALADPGTSTCKPDGAYRMRYAA